MPAVTFSPAAVFGCLPKRWAAKTCPGISRMFAQGGADLFLCKSGMTCAIAPHVPFYFLPLLLMLLHSYADVMLAEAMHMLLVRVGPSPFQPFPRLLALHSHITQTPAIAQ